MSAIKDRTLGDFTGIPKDVLFLIASFLSGRDTQALICTAKGFEALVEYKLWNNKLQKEFLWIGWSCWHPKKDYQRLYERHYTSKDHFNPDVLQLNIAVARIQASNTEEDSISTEHLRQLYLDCLPRAANGETNWFREKMEGSPAFKGLVEHINKQKNVIAYSPLLLAAANGNTELTLHFLGDLARFNDTELPQAFSKALKQTIIHAFKIQPEARAERIVDTAQSMITHGVTMEDYDWELLIRLCCEDDNVDHLKTVFSLADNKASLVEYALTYSCFLDCQKTERDSHTIHKINRNKPAIVCFNTILENEKLRPDAQPMITHDDIQYTLQEIVCVEGKVELLTQLLPVYQVNDRFNLMAHACDNGQLTCLQELSNRGYDITQQLLPGGHTLLQISTKSGHATVVQWLIEQDVLVTQPNAAGQNARYFALRHVRPDVFRIIDQNLNSPFNGSNEEFQSYFIAQALDLFHPEQEEPGDITLLQYASMHGSERDVRDVVDAGAKPNATLKTPLSSGKSPLFLCCQSNKKLAAIYLMTQGATIILKDSWDRVLTKNQPLVAASEQGNDVLINLMMNNLNKSVPNALAHSMLYALIEHKHLNVIKLLLPMLPAKAHDRFNMSQTDYNYALKEACQIGNLQCVTYLLEGADLNFVTDDHQKWTLLHFAVKGGNLEVIEYLLKCGLSQQPDGCNLLPINAFEVARDDDDEQSLKRAREIQELFNRYSNKHVVELRGQLHRKPIDVLDVNHQLCYLAEINGGDDAIEIYNTAIKILDTDDQTSQAELVVSMLTLACQKHPQIHQRVFRTVCNLYYEYLRKNIEPAASFLKTDECVVLMSDLTKIDKLSAVVKWLPEEIISELVHANGQALMREALDAGSENDISFLLCNGVDASELDDPKIKAWFDDKNNFYKYHLSQLKDIVSKLENEDIKNACTQFIENMEPDHVLLSATFPALAALLLKPCAEGIKTLLMENKVHTIIFSGKVAAYYHFLKILELILGITREPHSAIGIKELTQKHDIFYDSLLDLACYHNMGHFTRFALGHNVGTPARLRDRLARAYRDNNKSLFEMIHQAQVDHDETINSSDLNNIVLPGAVKFQSHKFVESNCKELLVKKDHKLTQGNTVLHLACQNNDLESIKLLIDAGWTVGAENANKKTPLELITDNKIVDKLLSWAIDKDKYPVIDGMIKHGVLTGSDALNVACSLQSYGVVDHLLNKEKSLDLAQFTDKNPLQLACEKGKLSIVSLLFSKMSDAEQKRDFILKGDSQSQCALHYGVRSGKARIIEILFTEVSDLPLNFAIANGSTPMQLAMQQKDKKDNEVVKALFKAGEALVIDPKDTEQQQIEKELASYKLENIKAALQRVCEQFTAPSATQKAELKTHVLNLCNETKKNTPENIAVLTEVRQAIEEKDVAALNKAAENYQAKLGNSERTAAILFSITAIALVIAGACLLALLTPVAVGAIVLAGAVTSGVIAGRMFYKSHKSRRNDNAIVDEVRAMNDCLQKQPS